MRGCGEKGLEGRTSCANTHARVESACRLSVRELESCPEYGLSRFRFSSGLASSSTPNQAVSSIRGWSSSCKEIVASPCLRQAGMSKPEWTRCRCVGRRVVNEATEYLGY